MLAWSGDEEYCFYYEEYYFINIYGGGLFIVYHALYFFMEILLDILYNVGNFFMAMSLDK